MQSAGDEQDSHCSLAGNTSQDVSRPDSIDNTGSGNNQDSSEDTTNGPTEE